MTKIFTKPTAAVDEVLAGDPKYQIKNDAGSVVYSEAEITLSTSVVTPGTGVTADRINDDEDAIDALDTKLNQDGVDIIKTTTGGGTALAVGAVADGDFVRREGVDIVGKTLAQTQVILHPNQLIGGVWHKQLWVGGFKPTLTNGCAPSAQIEMGTNKNVYDYLAFDASTIEYAYANVPMPSDYTGGVIYFKPYWLHPATTTNFKVSWGLAVVSFSNDDTLDAAQGTVIYSNDTGGTTSDLYIGDLSSAGTIAGTPVANDLVQLRCLRKADDATNDTLAVDAYLLGYMIYYPVA